MKKKNNNTKIWVIVGLIIAIYIMSSLVKGCNNVVDRILDNPDNDFVIATSYDYKVFEDDIVKYGKKNGIDVKLKYFGDLDIVDELNSHSTNYDGVWISNSMWLYMLDNNYLHSDSKSVGISPIVFGIKKNKAKELGLIGKDVSNNDIVNLIKDKKIKYVMNSVTQTNTGATAYLGFLTSLAGNPEVLTEDMLKDPKLIENLKSVFSGVERVSGDETYLNKMFLNDDKYEAVISSESSLININKELKKKNKEKLYFIYPSDGVAINDSTFAFIDNHKDNEKEFLTLQNYLLSDDGQKLLSDNGIRTWYGGVTDKPNKKIFNSDWGIDTTEYLNVTRFPSKDMITKSLNLYIESLRKPTHVVFCLDYSGSMSGSGYDELVSAMEYILTYEKASKDSLQFSEYDKITVIPFSDDVIDVWDGYGNNTKQLLYNIKQERPIGSTALYDAIIQGINKLDKESDEYTTTIIAMTDGAVNVGSFRDLERVYNKSKKKVPIYSITFGNAVESELDEIADLSNSKVFDGKTDLLRAFKEVRGYN